MFFNQQEFAIRCEWGPEGIRQLAPVSDAIVIIDVFSFTTAVDVALSRGAKIYPYRWKDESTLDFARSVGALAAVASRRDPTGFSLSPASLMRLPENTPIVLPSPNGATLSMMTGGCPTFAGCLRNAQAVAEAAMQASAVQASTAVEPRISVIPGGEKWEDGSLRPAMEDLLGAGAVIHYLPGARSPEAEMAEAAFLHFQDHLETALAACSSGKEAADRGTAEDVRLAAALNVSRRAPRLINGAYQ